MTMEAYLDLEDDADRLDAFWPMWNRTESHHRPHLLLDAVESGFADELSDEGLYKEALVDAYTSRNVNMGGDLRPSDWLLLFRRQGFVSDGPPVPTSPITVYRGCLYWKVRAPAWTTDLDVALWFANRSPEQSVVWTATVEPRHVLGVFAEMDEAEVVVSPFAPPLRNSSLTVAVRDAATFAAGADRVIERRTCASCGRPRLLCDRRPGPDC